MEQNVAYIIYQNLDLQHVSFVSSKTISYKSFLNNLQYSGVDWMRQSQESPELCRGNCMWAKQIARFPSQLFRSPEEPQLSTPNMPDWHTRSRADALPNSRKKEQKIIH